MTRSSLSEATIMAGASAFGDDLAHDLDDPDFLREFVIESVRIATIDEVVNAPDDARESGWPK